MLLKKRLLYIQEDFTSSLHPVVQMLVLNIKEAFQIKYSVVRYS